MKDIFDRYYKRYDTWYDRNKFAYLSELKVLRKVLPKKGKGLEVGVGTGRFAAPLKIRTGIDPSKKMIKLAQKRGVDARLGFGEKLPFKNATFDYVVIIITICFVQNPIKVLKEAKRVLRKNGKLIIGIVDRDTFLGKVYQRKKSKFYKQAHFFNTKELTALFRLTHFKRISYHQTLFKLPGKIKVVEEPQKGFGKGGFVVIVSRKSSITK